MGGRPGSPGGIANRASASMRQEGAKQGLETGLEAAIEHCSGDLRLTLVRLHTACGGPTAFFQSAMILH